MKIKILGNTWEVKTSTVNDIADVMATENRWTVGACDYKRKIIHLSQELTQEMWNQTLIHELVHAIHLETGISEFLNDREKEQYCEFIKFAYPIIEDVLKQIESDNHHATTN